MVIATMSDTHGRHKTVNTIQADVVVHCGDFSHSLAEAREFVEWYSTYPAKHKLLVAGNHDESVEEESKAFKSLCNSFGVTYLEDESVVIDGIKFYGTPWTPRFYNWAFMEYDEKLKAIFDKIDNDTDILLTHGPAKGLQDMTQYGDVVGSESLRCRISKLNLTAHVFGHIHEARGIMGDEEDDEISYLSINTSMVGARYEILPMYVFEVKGKNETHILDRH